MNHRYCVIVCAGTFNAKDFIYPQNAYIIAADGGYAYLDKLGIIPNIAIGDFDSLNYVPSMLPKNSVIKLIPEKDDTDTLYCIKHALSLGYDRILLFGALGGDRVDHTIANIQALSFIANNNAQGYIIENDKVITAISNKAIKLKAKKSGTVSVFSSTSRAEGVTLKGLKYTLNNAALSSDTPLGVSNEYIGEEAEIAVLNGTLTIVFDGKYTDLTD